MANQPPVSLRVEVLGPLRAFVAGVAVDVRGPKRRAVLALLALAEGRTVTRDSLADALWPQGVPDSGRQAIHTLISRLRGHLGDAAGRLVTTDEGYRLELDRDELDVARARLLLAIARRDTSRDPAAAFVSLREAEGLWRGPALGDLRDVPPIAAAVTACEQLQRDVRDALIAAAVGAGRADDVIGLAQESLAADPLREPAVLLLMRALAATGRAPEALQIARDFRGRLADETGLDPSAALGELERAIAGGGEAAAGSAGSTKPVPPARLVGRDSELAALHRLLASERLVTLVGPGGIGKTSVALELARRSGDATVVLLGPVADASGLPHALAGALDLEVAQGDVIGACLALLGTRSGLLVIDNCEHLLDGVRDLMTRLLATCPRLHVLATSREPIGLTAEYTSRLGALSLPRSGGDPRRSPSVEVFLRRARRVRPDLVETDDALAAVADIVTRLDGMPLAIELAAGRLTTFNLGELRDRLDRVLDVLGGSAPSGEIRHRTLRTTVEWSYRLLADPEQRLFRHLSVFVDGFDLRTAERIATELAIDEDPASVLARLVDASMVQAMFEPDETRYRMLEPLRAFGVDRLVAAGEHAPATALLRRWAVELASWFQGAVTTDEEPRADAVLRRELPNLRAAWRSARGDGQSRSTTAAPLRPHGELYDAVAIVTACFDAIAYRDLIELRDWAEELARDPALVGHPRASEVLGAAAEAAYHRGDYRGAAERARAGFDVATSAYGRWACLVPLAVAELARGAFADVVTLALDAAEATETVREAPGIAALACVYAGDPRRAHELNQRGLEEASSPTLRAWGAYVTGEIASAVGDAAAAEPCYLDAIEVSRASGATFLSGVASVGLLSCRAASGRVDEALDGYLEVIEYFARTGNWTHLWVTLRNLADLLDGLGDPATAELLHAAADAAPDAPAGRPRPARVTADHVTVLSDRAAVLEVAREAIARARSSAGGEPGGSPADAASERQSMSPASRAARSSRSR